MNFDMASSMKEILNRRGRIISALVIVFAMGNRCEAGNFKPADPARIGSIAACLKSELKVFTPGSGRQPTEAEKTDCIRKAEPLLKERPEPFARELYLEFSRNGNRSRFESWRESFLNRFGRLCEAEGYEAKGRFSAAIVAYFEAISGWPSWTLPAHDKGLSNLNGTHHYVDLFAAEVARVLAERLVEFGPRLPEATIRKVRAAMDRHVFDSYLATAAVTDFTRPNWTHGNWWFDGDNNWNAVCHSCCVRAALAAIPDIRTRARFIEAAERGLDAYFSGFAPDGYCSEGMGYWNYGYGHFLMMGLAVRDATQGKVDFFRHPCAEAAMRYPIAYQLQKGVSPRFSDGSGNPNPLFLRWGYGIWPALRSEVEGALPIRSAFPDGQVWISRLDSSARHPFAIALKGGHNAENHNHNDIGSWAIMLDGQALIGDPGGEIYTRRTFSKDRYLSDVLNSFGHPVPRIGGKLQCEGRKFAAKVISTDFRQERDVVSLELSGAYCVPGLKSLMRTMTFDRREPKIVIADRVMCGKPLAFDDPIIVLGEFLADYTPGDFAIETADGKARLKGGVEVKGGAWHWRKELVDNPQCRSPKRIAVTFDEPVTEADVVWTFRAKL